ncbi:uncharacterized protein F5147DRAFT_684506 [Suillus discolor]|uniref:Uncharacterized protein n=1 Tax=Suillus discolor TaxID=1912936 RepID=A0A9P7FBC4_9AGAM|nr:uncharacterized protein F5147DRAFT_684506 [Suillus discolor]KAG2112286.1 hypothetical protein F5147DRAFT_684506 [Suillus discolor]
MFGVGCIAWSMAQDIVTAPIVGTTSLKHLQDLLGAISITPTPEERKYLRSLSTKVCLWSDKSLPIVEPTNRAMSGSR